MKKVRDIMTRDITSVTENDTMKDVARILANSHLRGVPVVDDDNRVTGFVSERDVVQSEFPQMGHTSSIFLVRDFANLARRLTNVGNQKVKDFMTHNPITVEEDDTLMDVVRLILERGIKVIPVIRDGELIGVIGRAEVCAELIESGSL